MSTVVAQVKADVAAANAELLRGMTDAVAAFEARTAAEAAHQKQVDQEAAARLLQFGDALTRRIARATAEA